MARREIPRIYSFTPDTGYKPKRRISLSWSIGLTVALSVLLTVFVNGFAAHAETKEPGEQELINVVFDGADLFTPEEEEEINLHAKELLETYGTAMAVEVVPTINGKDIEGWTVDRANERRVGSAELDNGLFYGIALDDREFYVAKGSGYAAIPDYKLQEILDGQMVPLFKDGDFAQGIIDSSESFGQLAVSPDATEDTRAEESAAASKRAGEIAGAIGVWAIGIIGTLGITAGGIFTVLTVKRRKREKIAAAERVEQERILAEARAEQNRLRAERERIEEAARRKRVKATEAVDSRDWAQFAELGNGKLRRQWLRDRGVFAAAFDLAPGTEVDSDQQRLLEQTIASERFGAIRFLEQTSVVESQKEHEREQERQRIAREAELKRRREEEAVQRDAQGFWQGLSNSQKKEYGKLRSEQDRQRWISDNGGSNIFGLHPAIAIAMFLSLSNDHTRAEQRAADEAARAESARSSSTDYSSSSYTDYSSSSMFGGGSFDGGGGGGGSW